MDFSILELNGNKYNVKDEKARTKLKNLELISILDLGAKADDPSFDNSTVINEALSIYKKVYIPKGTFYIANSIILNNDNELFGCGNGSIIHMSNGDDKKSITGDGVENLYIHDVTFRNTESGTGSTVSPQLIGYFDNVKNVVFERVFTTEINSKGYEFISSSNLTFRECKFYKAGYSMLTILTECENVLVDNCHFEKITSTYDGGIYLFSTGAYDYDVNVEYMCKNVTVQNSTFIDNPLWEGIESHGCENLKILNNVIHNCKYGIMTKYDTRKSVSNILCDNCLISGNIITADDDIMHQAIIVEGSQSKMRKNVVVENNYIENTGNFNNTSYGITVAYLSNFKIRNNEINKLYAIGIDYVYSQYGLVESNYIHNANGRVDYGIYSEGSWFVNVVKNAITQNSNDTDRKYIAYACGSNTFNGLNLPSDNIASVLSSKYNYRDNTLINPTSHTEAKRLGCMGVKCVDENDIVTGYFTDKVVRSVEGTSGLKATANSGSNRITFDSSVFPIRTLAPGQEIVITGAGDSGSNLTTTILDYEDLHSIILKDTIKTSVNSVDILTTNSTLEII